jgi:hypothetical protein
LEHDVDLAVRATIGGSSIPREECKHMVTRNHRLGLELRTPDAAPIEARDPIRLHGELTCGAVRCIGHREAVDLHDGTHALQLQ